MLLRILVFFQAFQSHLIFAQAATLALQGQDNKIEFGTENKAIIRASCEADQPSAKFIKPRVLVGEPNAGNVTVEFNNVAPTCLNSPIDTPCASHDPEYPALFWCAFKGGSDETKTGPVRAYPVEVRASGGELLGLAVRADCHWPSYDEIQRITGYSGNGEPVTIKLNVLFFADAAPNAQSIPFVGMPDGNAIQISGLPTPPLPPSPSAPPSPSIPPSPASVRISSDGSYEKPFCSWSSSCAWTAGVQAECALKMCERSGYTTAVYVSATGNMCTHNPGLSGHYWNHDDQKYAEGSPGVEAGITADCM